ncbi:Crp/Fnr family transcriptional regulator [uncultured Microbulbifer sp.]|uniref:Crp/Fnr family transcriptional regulator n=1 Tax=uncultured Microbulbifer sp. TaxID=348147 RepID=UPI002637646E|nr:Crp/Fnr family transcriptional regulator [uncultured Microbulbifer sp.]
MNIQKQMNNFIDYFCSPGSSLEASDFRKYGLSGELRHLKKGHYLIRQGQPASKIYFMLSGYARYMSVSPDGKEFTQSFACAPCVAGSTRAMTRKTRALFSIEALDDVLCLGFEWPDFFEKMKDQPGFLLAYSTLLESMFIKKEEREYSFVQLSAEQRYLDFLEQNPQLRERLPLKMIASYIGITPIALSRIRKKING